MKKLLLISFCFVSHLSSGQNDLGIRLLIYPAGKITTLQYSYPNEKNWTWNVEAGYNFTQRQDFGVHDNEEGGGPGFGIGIRKFLKNRPTGWYAEMSTQLWFMQIDWKDDFDCPPNADCLPNQGKTNITVFQPTLGAGHSFQSKSEKWAASLGIAFGREFNIRTKGEEVGQGGISLLTFSIARQL